MFDVLISIIVPVYNAEKYINRCIDSVLAQTFSDFELILVDDGSLDNSGSICDEYAEKDNRIKVIHQKNQGVSAARQCGLNVVSGEYVIHIDPDDWIELDMLECLYKKAKESYADMVICDFFVEHTSRTYISNQKPSSLDNISVQREMFQGKLHGSCWNKLIRRDCFTIYEVKFPNNVNFCEDLYTNGLLLNHKIKIEYVDKAFYHYDNYSNNSSLVRMAYSEKNYKNDLLLQRYIKDNFKETPNYQNILIWADTNIVTRAWESQYFDDKEFSQRFYNLSSQMLNSYHCRMKNVMLFLACKGYSSLSYKTYNFYVKIISVLRNSIVYRILCRVYNFIKIW